MKRGAVEACLALSISYNSYTTLWPTKPEGYPSIKIPTENFVIPNKQYKSNRRIQANIQRNSYPSSPGSDSHPTSKPHHPNPTTYCGPSEKKTLPRVHRTGISQLHSGFRKALNSYHNRLDPSINPACPECSSGEPHTTNHLFYCLSHPTELDVRESWLRPDRVSRFVSSLPYFHYLPLLLPPPPEPPPTGPAPWSRTPNSGGREQTEGCGLGVKQQQQPFGG